MIVSDVLTHIGQQAERELDSLSDRLPPAKQPKMTFEEYLPRALEYARTNEKFARQLARALHQAQRSGV